VTATVVSCVFGSTLGVGDPRLVHVTVNVAARAGVRRRK